MKVKELVSLLLDCDPDATIFAFTDEPCEIVSVDEVDDVRVDINITIGGQRT